MTALITVGWIGVSAYQPDWLRVASVETDVVVCVVLVAAALGLVSAVAIAHTRTRDSTDQGKG